MEERAKKSRAYDSAQSRRQEYKNACKRLQRQCYLTYEKLREIRQQKERYRRIFLGTPGIFQIAQQILGFEQYERKQLGAEGFSSKLPWIKVHWERLCGLLEELKKGAPPAPMSESQYAYNLNLDWERLDSPERKRLRRRLIRLLEEETKQLSEEEQDEEYALFCRLAVHLTDCLGELNELCGDYFCQRCVRLREAFYEEGVRFLGYEEAVGAVQGEWFETVDRGGRLPCVIWETESPRLLLYGREEADRTFVSRLKTGVEEYARLRAANQREEEFLRRWQAVEEEVSGKLSKILELMEPTEPLPEPDYDAICRETWEEFEEFSEGKQKSDARTLAQAVSLLDSRVEEQRRQAEFFKEDEKLQRSRRLYELLKEYLEK